MLERTSRFVLEVLPYLLTALIAAVVLPQFLYSQGHATKAVIYVSGRANDLVRVGGDVNVTHPASWGSDQSW